MTNAVPQIPRDLLPADGRFGAGPSRVRRSAIDALSGVADTYLGTSHRQPTVRDQVARLRRGLTELLELPDSWEIVLGNGGSTIFWDAATFGLVERRSQHVTCGEFSGKFAAATTAAPFLDEPDVISVEPGRSGAPSALAGVDAYCLTHNETSTGVMNPIERPTGADDGSLVLVDATSVAGAARWDHAAVDVYYFAPQKVLASDGGLWLAACSPAAIERIGAIGASDRWIPTGIDLATALDNSRKEQTYNTPALATIFLAAEQVDWLNGEGGLDFAERRCRATSAAIYDWAAASPVATPFVDDPAARSIVVCTVDFDGVDAAEVAKVLRANGVVDVEPYRKLGRNQLRIATFPAVPVADVEALLACIDWVVERVGNGEGAVA
ncbi:MAG: phosphoserine transaminase [Actinomycetota bacterium]